jgi:hypothetical protein
LAAPTGGQTGNPKLNDISGKAGQDGNSMVKQADSQTMGEIQQGSDIELDRQYHEIGIPALYAATHCTRSQVQQKDYTTQQQTAPMFSYED